jgi:hypothetical protein
MTEQTRETTIHDVVHFILKGNCPDCFHPECLARVDVVKHLMRVLEAEANGVG